MIHTANTSHPIPPTHPSLTPTPLPHDDSHSLKALHVRLLSRRAASVAGESGERAVPARPSINACRERVNSRVSSKRLPTYQSEFHPRLATNTVLTSRMLPVSGADTTCGACSVCIYQQQGVHAHSWAAHTSGTASQRVLARPNMCFAYPKPHLYSTYVTYIAPIYSL